MAVKIFIVLGLAIVGFFILDLQVDTKWACEGSFDIGMRDLKNREAAFLQHQQQILLDALTAPPEEPTF